MPIAQVHLQLDGPACLRDDYAVRAIAGAWAVADDAGRFTLEKVRPGAHRVDIFTPLGQFHSLDAAVVREGETTTGVDLAIEE